MISAAEIESKSKEFEIHTSDVQRDYVFGWLLFCLFTESTLKEEIFLKGGNALRKGYFQNTRYSADLDLGIPHDIDQEILRAEMNRICAIVQEKTGIVFIQDDTLVEEKFTATATPLPDLKVYDVRIYFKDFFGNSKHMRLRVSMDLTRFDKVLLDIQKVPLIHPYSDATEVSCVIRCMKLEEIIATKLKCMMQRQHAPDLFDYAYSIKLLGGKLNKEEVVQTLIKKTIFDRNPFILKGILSSVAFTYFREEWAKSVVCAKQFLINVEDAIASFVADLEILFVGYTDNGYAQSVYFDPEARAKIMQAGRTQTLMKVRYQGYDRIVEPYSLKYLKVKSGEWYEYFYAYNRTGGKSEPGMRSFLPGPLESIENTDEKFELKYPIEVSKAGEIPENPYLFDPNKPIKARVSSARVLRSQTARRLRYSFKCSVCGKRFTRNDHNPSLNPHKGKGGYSCYGTYGVYVGTKYQ